MKWLFRFAVMASAGLLAATPARAAFSSMQVFGDGLSTITGNVSPGTNYYGNRYCNGRVWVEVLAQRQGLTLPASNNVSYFGQYSSNLVVNVGSYVPPSNAASTLFVVWVNSADFINVINYLHPNPFYPTNIVVWTNNINASLSNHLVAIQMLYAKGARTLVMPNGVDVAKVPQFRYMSSTNKAFVRQRIVDYNRGFSNVLQQARTSLGNLTIVSPDFFSFVEDIIPNPARYGFTNSTSDALEDFGNTPLSGPGTNYVFWDYLNPTAKVQAILADTAQTLLSPAQVAALTNGNGSNQLNVLNVPIGLNGFVDASTNFAGWSPVQAFTSSIATQSVLVPASGPVQFYRLRFPYAWSWP